MRELLHIYGPISIQSYGVAIAVGVIIFLKLSLLHPWRKKLLSQEQHLQSIILGILAGIVGGRLLFAAQNWHEFSHWNELIHIWDGGFSVLGSIIGILLCLPIYLKAYKIPILPYLDLIALFAPLLQAIARLGCFFAGCCHGTFCNHSWCVTYTDPLSLAPLNIALYPTQLYSSITLFAIFIVLYFFLQKRLYTSGQLFSWYLILMGAERFFVDFWRADREFPSAYPNAALSTHQFIAIILIVLGAILLTTRIAKHQSDL